jgi:hypothetical protein
MARTAARVARRHGPAAPPGRTTSRCVIALGRARLGAMPRQEASLSTERRAMQVVRAEEEARGRTITVLSKTQEREHGCDFVSRGPDGGTEFVEVKGWGESLLRDADTFSYPADLNRQQYERACAEGSRFRLEIVAGLTAERANPGMYERLTLSGEDVQRLAEPWKYQLALNGLQAQIRHCGRAPS